MTEQRIETLDEIVERNQVWPVMAAKYGVANPLPPWKTSLDGLCDVLDHACTESGLDLSFKQRRDEEDELSATRYADLPYPESQLVALAHSLLARGLINEQDLRARLAGVRARLEA
ncbi:MAG: thiocyanate hydrolase [Mycobacterium sp.]